MLDATIPPLAAWANFYVIVGSSAGALTGLVFVVITLVAGTQLRTRGEGVAAFGTPNVVHFGAALGIAAILSAPWQALWAASLPLGLAGAGGVAYIAVVARHMRRQGGYRPVLEDWVWHVHFPLVTYVALVVSAPLLPGNPDPILFVTGAALLLLLFIGIHNAWDTVTYIVVDYSQPRAEEQD